MIERRYLKGVKNLFEIYLPIVDRTLIFDNSFGKHQLIATNIGKLEIHNKEKFEKLKNINYGK